MDPLTEKAQAAPTRIAGVPAWLFYCLITILLWGVWGVVSKTVSDRIDANTNQIYFTLGLLPITFLTLRSPQLQVSQQSNAGIRWAFLTGILAGTGNMAFFHALTLGGRASIVIPATALFPVVTIILATAFLQERVSTAQKIGLILAMVAIYLLSLPG